MFKFLTSFLLSLFKPTDIAITLNGSSITFTKEGDVKVIASRNLIENAKYIFSNCTEKDINDILFNLNPSIERYKDVKPLEEYTVPASEIKYNKNVYYETSKKVTPFYYIKKINNKLQVIEGLCSQQLEEEIL